MKTEEGYIEVPGGKVWYRAVMEACGNQAKSAGLRQQRRQARLATASPAAPR